MPHGKDRHKRTREAPLSLVNPRHPPSFLQAAWATVKRLASHGKKGVEVPVGSKCLGCVATVSTWPELSWAEAVSRAKSQAEFAQAVTAAKRVWKSRGDLKRPEWLPESLGEEKMVGGVRVKRKFDAYTAEDLDKIYGKGASQNPALDWQEIQDEYGQKLRVILVTPAGPSRRVTVEGHTHLHLKTEVSKPEYMLRPRQHVDLMASLAEKNKKKCFKFLAGDVFEEVVQSYEGKRSCPAAIAAPPAPLAAHAAAAAAAVQETEPEKDEGEIIDVGHLSAATMADMLAEDVETKGGQGERQGQSKSKLCWQEERLAF